MLVRFLRFLMWPVRISYRLFLVSRISRTPKPMRAFARRMRSKQNAIAAPAMAVAAYSAAANDAEPVKVKYSVLFKSVEFPDHEAQARLLVDNSDLANHARRFYEAAPSLFPSDEKFYEEVEYDFLKQVADSDEGGSEFINALQQVRRVSNDNTRILFVEIAPLALILTLAAYALMLFADPLHLLHAGARIWTDYLGVSGLAEIVSALVALGVSALVVFLVYSFSYKHVQRENGLRLNGYVTSEFARLNDIFLQAKNKCQRLEQDFNLSEVGQTEEGNAQKQTLEAQSGAWALCYHWIGILQFHEAMAIRNTMFQIRRNAALYAILGVLICLCAVIVFGGAGALLAGALHMPVAGAISEFYALAIGLGFTALSYGLIMRRPFDVFRDKHTLDTESWARAFRRTAIPDTIANQIAEDKAQFAILRDRRR